MFPQPMGQDVRMDVLLPDSERHVERHSSVSFCSRRTVPTYLTTEHTSFEKIHRLSGNFGLPTGLCYGNILFASDREHDRMNGS